MRSKSARYVGFAAVFLGFAAVVVVLGGTQPPIPATTREHRGLRHKTEVVEPKKKTSRNSFSPLHPDPSVLTWLDPSRAQPGKITCGFMRVPLGNSFNSSVVVFPKVRVYVCMRFNEVQPAPNGVLFLHCGGPATLSGCGLESGTNYGFDKMGYDLASIDQRGLGRSLPTMATSSCSEVPYPGDSSDEQQVLAYLRRTKDRNTQCWHDQSFQLLSPDGTTTFNFLQYSGTKQVVDDLNSFRQAIGAEKLSIYGMSYGCMIGASYATVFPDSLDKLVLNSPTPTSMNMNDFALAAADGTQQVWDYINFVCSFEEGCPISHSLEETLDAIFSRMRESSAQQRMVTGSDGVQVEVSPGLLTGLLLGRDQKPDFDRLSALLERIEKVYQAALNFDLDGGDAFWGLIKKKMATVPGRPTGGTDLNATEQQQVFDNIAQQLDVEPQPIFPSSVFADTYSLPTFGELVAGQPHYHSLMNPVQDGNGNAFGLVVAQSTSVRPPHCPHLHTHLHTHLHLHMHLHSHFTHLLARTATYTLLQSPCTICVTIITA